MPVQLGWAFNLKGLVGFMFGWLFRKPRFRFYEDSFARTRSSMLVGVKQALETRMQAGDSFLVVTHFPDTFVEIQQQLAAWSMDYQICSTGINPFALTRMFAETEAVAKPQIVLSLSELLLNEETAPEAIDAENKICVMALERHPNVAHDENLEVFCRQIPSNVELGYFLSFEDAVVCELINDSMLRILDLFGMGENELITSNMVSRRLKQVLNHSSRYYQTDQAADSAKEWIELNRPRK